MVERELPKLLVWVRFPSPAIPFTFVKQPDDIMKQRSLMLSISCCARSKGKGKMKTILIQMMMITSLTSVAYAGVNDSAVNVKWGYKENVGPTVWGQLSPQFALCGNGKSQSPINIKKSITAANTLTVNYEPSSWAIMNDGVSKLLIGGTQTLVNDDGLQVDFADDNHESIILNGTTYRLIQFHIHTPSEHQLQGRAYPLEIHFVHQGPAGQVAVIGVFVKGGTANTELQKMIDHLPTDHHVAHTIQGETLNTNELLPTKRDFYHLMGSLTTPPCTEGLQWVVMATPITASPAQIMQIRGATGGSNARPVQPLNGRYVSFSAYK